MLNCFSYVLALQGVLAKTPSSAVLVLLALVCILVSYTMLKVWYLMTKRVPWTSYPGQKGAEKWRKQSIVKRMHKKRRVLQRRAKSFSSRIRESAFPSNQSDGLMKLFDENDNLTKLLQKPDVSFNAFMCCGLGVRGMIPLVLFHAVSPCIIHYYN